MYVCVCVCKIFHLLSNDFYYFRPTATELLKHPFFKKAKDKKYLQQTLVAIGPSLETRVQKVCTRRKMLFFSLCI